MPRDPLAVEILKIIEEDRQRQEELAMKELDELEKKVKAARKNSPSVSGSMLDALGIFRHRGFGPGHPAPVSVKSSPGKASKVKSKGRRTSRKVGKAA